MSSNIVIALIAFLFSICVTYYWSKHREKQREDERQRLREFVKELPGWQPTFVVMHVEDNYNYLEIAAKLEMPAQFVLSELTKAYATLRSRQLEHEPGSRARWKNVRIRLIYRLFGGV